MVLYSVAWVFVVLGDSYDLDTHSWNPDGIRVLRQQDFWFCLGITILCVGSLVDQRIASYIIFSIIIPWVTVREVEVDVEIVGPVTVISPQF